MTSSLAGRTFAAGETVWSFREDRLTGAVTASFSGGAVLTGALVGTRDGRTLTYRTAWVERSGLDRAGSGDARLEPDRVTVDEVELVEVPGPRWLRARVARPVASVATATAFYRDVLGLAVTGSFTDHAGYDGVFLALPGGGELELTEGPSRPLPTSPDDLLCLYLAGTADRDALVATLPADVVRVAPENPYWADFGVTVLDPDGYRVVLAVPPGE